MTDFMVAVIGRIVMKKINGGESLIGGWDFSRACFWLNLSKPRYLKICWAQEGPTLLPPKRRKKIEKEDVHGSNTLLVVD